MFVFYARFLSLTSGFIPQAELYPDGEVAENLEIKNISTCELILSAKADFEVKNG